MKNFDEKTAILVKSYRRICSEIPAVNFGNKELVDCPEWKLQHSIFSCLCNGAYSAFLEIQDYIYKGYNSESSEYEWRYYYNLLKELSTLCRK